ncbi:MAG TPA: uroporphyrinogen-III C-methyltransferase [Burkholderiaceae bacterium]|nr:uroporphyrinogen-III C-methyltransferase [Burkholderiaceae bacterium]
MVLLGVALVALLLSGMLWQRLDHIQQELAKRAASVADESEQSRETAEEAKTLTQELQARLTVAEVKLSEVSLQRTQLEELMLSVSRSRDDTLVLDIESGIRLAIQQAELTGSAQPLVSALQAADRRIAKAAQPRLNPVQRAMARDLERIKASSVADLPLLAARLDELARSVDDWVLTQAAPVSRTKSAVPAVAKSTPVVSSVAPVLPAPRQPPDSTPAEEAEDAGPPSTPVAASSGAADGAEASPPTAAATPAAPKPAPVHKANKSGRTAPVAAEPAPSAMSEGWAGWSLRIRSLWDDWMRQVAQAGRDLVRVSRIDEPDAVLLAPEQAVFMRENLKLRLLNIRLSLLARQIPAARADMQFVRAALTKYFDPQAPMNKQALLVLNEVLQASRTLDLPRPDDTLSALATAAGGR